MTVDYPAFLARKAVLAPASGMQEIPPLPPMMKQFQRDLTAWALRRGRCAVFAGTGLGKTLTQQAWARAVSDHIGAPVLGIAPLAVAQQSVVEARKFGISGVSYAASDADVASDLPITNYDRLHLFDPAKYGGVYLDESSIIKSHDSKTRAALIAAFSMIRWRLCCSATPAPNDFTELGNHSEFLGIMTEKEMLSMFFVHDGKVRAKGSQGSDGWRLKRHAERDFWRWLASWAAVVRDPNEIGYDEPDYVLPPLIERQVTVEVPYAPSNGCLFPMEARTMRERVGARKESLTDRVAAAAAIVNAEPNKPWLVWCHLNTEADALVKAIPGSEQVTGSEDRQTKSDKLLGFICGRPRVLISKPSIAGLGLNYQHCADMVFVGLSDSFEQLFQAKRRCWRFGQRNAVTAHLICSELEGAVLSNLRRKEADYEKMTAEMAVHMRDLVRGELAAAPQHRPREYVPQRPMEAPAWL